MKPKVQYRLSQASSSATVADKENIPPLNSSLRSTGRRLQTQAGERTRPLASLSASTPMSASSFTPAFASTSASASTSTRSSVPARKSFTFSAPSHSPGSVDVESEIYKFLDSGIPSMAHHLPLLLNVGCTSAEDLLGISTWSRETIEIFLGKLPPREDGGYLSEMDKAHITNHFWQYFQAS